MSIENISLAHAVKNKDLICVKKLLTLGVDVNEKDDGKPALFIAVEKEFYEIAHQLIKYGANLDLKCDSGSRDGYTSLHVAVEDRNIEIINLLLNSGANVNSKNKWADTPFHCMFYSNSIITKRTHSLEEDEEIALLLLHHGADIYAMNSLEQTVLHLAAKTASVKVMKSLLQYQVDVNAKDHFGYTLFHWLVSPNFGFPEKEVRLSDNKCKQIAELLIRKGADIHATTKREQNLLHLAATAGRVEIVKLLLKCDIDMTSRDCNDYTPLILAIKGLHMEVVRLLLQYNIDVNYEDLYGLMPLHYTYHTNIDTQAFGPICKQIAELLIDKGADIHARNKTGETHLHLVARNGCVEIVELLIKRGANVRVTDRLGVQPIFMAAEAGHLKAIKLLVKAGVNVNDIILDSNLCLLHFAAKAGHENVIKYLVQAGANINVPGFEVGTPLQFAVEYNCLFPSFSKSRSDAIDALLECGADINLKNTENKTPFQCILGSNINVNLINVFVKHIAKLKSQHMYVSKENIEHLHSHPRINYFFKKCLKEISKMKAKEVNHTKIKYFDIFRKDIHALTMYANNKDIIKSLECEKVSTKFPIYANIICNRFQQGIERKVLVDKCIEMFCYISNLPNCCSENICLYLEEKDLENLISACLIQFKQELCNPEEVKVGFKHKSEVLDVYKNTKKHKSF